MRYARIYPWRRTRRFRAPSNGPEAFFVAQFSAGYTTNMFGFDLRQGQYPVFKLLPQMYDWTMQLRIRRLYDEIRSIESDMEAQGPQFDANALNTKLDQIDQRANHLHLPTVYASNLYTLLSHIDLLRARLAKIPV